jgi:hypothetical protein
LAALKIAADQIEREVAAGAFSSAGTCGYESFE